MKVMLTGYAKEVKDNIRAGLEFLPNHPTNIAYGWKMLDESGKETKDPTKAKEIVTDYLSKAKDARGRWSRLRFARAARHDA